MVNECKLHEFFLILNTKSHIYIYIYVCVCVCACDSVLYIYVHTHTHTQIYIYEETNISVVEYNGETTGEKIKFCLCTPWGHVEMRDISTYS